MIDSQSIYSRDQAVLLSGDTPSTNMIDAGSALSSDIGLGADEVFLNVICAASASSGGAATVQAVLQDSADGFAYADVIGGAVFPVASVTQGTVILQVPYPTRLRQYTRVVYRVGNGPLTGGKFNAFVSLGIQRNISRASGFAVF